MFQASVVIGQGDHKQSFGNSLPIFPILNDEDIFTTKDTGVGNAIVSHLNYVVLNLW